MDPNASRNPNTWSSWFTDNTHQTRNPSDNPYPAESRNDYAVATDPNRPQSFFPTRPQTTDYGYFDHANSIPLSATPATQYSTAHASTPSDYHYEEYASPAVPVVVSSPIPRPHSPPVNPYYTSQNARDTNSPYYSDIGTASTPRPTAPQVPPHNSYTPTQDDYGIPNSVSPDPSEDTYGRQYYNDDPIGARTIPIANPPGIVQQPPTPTDPRDKVLLDPKVIAQIEGRRKWRPWFCWLTALAMTGVLVYELVRNKEVTGNIIELSPINIMIGPSSTVLVGLGARFVPCMRVTVSYPPSAVYMCPNMTDVTTNSTSSATCTLEDVCLLSAFKNALVPDQWYRFITPIFIHGGVVHLLMNMLVQLRLGAQLERDMGPFRFAMIYFSAGIAGFIFGGNFAPIKQPSMGCSGALFGLIGCLLVDLIQNWRMIARPWWELSKLLILTLVSFAFGLLPFLDNFSHIGGFFTGIFAGIVFMPPVYFSTKHKWGNWIARAISLPILVVIFYLGITNFYSGSDPSAACPWCKYLSCLPIDGLCDAYINNT